MYLLPQPTKIIWQEGIFRLRYDTAIVIDTAVPAGVCQYVCQYAKLLQEEIAEDTGLRLPIRRESAGVTENGVLLLTWQEAGPVSRGGHLAGPVSGEACPGGPVSGETRPAGPVSGEARPAGPRGAEHPEGYRLQVAPTQVRVTASTPTGVLYGVQTLRQMVRQAGAVLPCALVEDEPKLSDRGLSYDVSRGRVPTLEELKRQADLCSFYKLNQLQLYVEHTYLFREFSEVWRRNTPLTAEEILELDAYCGTLGIDLVPSLSSFGHLYDVLRTKTYSHLCELEDAEREEYSLTGRMAHHTVNVSDEESFAMVAGRIEEFMGLFSTGYFNICGDETFDLCKGRSRALGEERGVKRVYLDFLKRLCDLVGKNGKIPMYWGDVLLEKPGLLSEMPQDAICLNWEYYPEVTEEKTRLLTEAGVKHMYLCPGVQSWNHLINRHSDAYRNISLMCRNAHKYGAQGVLNTEWGDLGHIAHPEFSTVGQIYGAAFSWSDQPMAEEEINRAISVLQYGDAKGELVSLFRDLADTECVNWWHAVQYKEEQQGRAVRREKEPLSRILLVGLEVAQSRLLRGRELSDRLYGKLTEVSPQGKRDVCAYLVMGEGQELLTRTGRALYERSQGRPLTDRPGELAVRIEYWLAEYQKLWRSVSKESELFRVTEVFCWYADRLRDMEDTGGRTGEAENGG